MLLSLIRLLFAHGNTRRFAAQDGKCSDFTKRKQIKRKSADPLRGNLLSGFGGERFNDGDIGKQLGREMVACLEIGRRVVRDPDLSGGVFGNEDFEREVES